MMAEIVQKLPTGIAGLDNMLYGGVPVTNQVLIAGGPGAGKTLICFEICYNNAKAGVPSIFITLEESPDDILKNVRSAFTDMTDIDDLVSKKMLKITGIEVPPGTVGSDEVGSFGRMVTGIEEAVKSMGAKCVAIDSLSVLKLVSSEDETLSYRRAVMGLIATLRKLDVTAFLTIELSSAERKEMKFSQEFFIFDGIFVLYQSEANERRTLNLEIIKMRRSNHSLSFSPYEVTSKGFRVFAVEQEAY